MRAASNFKTVTETFRAPAHPYFSAQVIKIVPPIYLMEPEFRLIVKERLLSTILKRSEAPLLSEHES